MTSYIRDMQSFPAARSNTFPFVRSTFLERQFPTCTRHHIYYAVCSGIVHCLSPFITAANLITLSFWSISGGQIIHFLFIWIQWKRMKCFSPAAISLNPSKWKVNPAGIQMMQTCWVEAKQRCIQWWCACKNKWIFEDVIVVNSATQTNSSNSLYQAAIIQLNLM